MSPNTRQAYPHVHAPAPGIIPVPGGPHEYTTLNGSVITEGDESYGFQRGKDEHEIFRHLLHPSDAYTQEGVYWADLPLKDRMKFNARVEYNEFMREAKAIWQTFIKDPLAPVGWYFNNAIIPGAGLLLEGYVLFSIGNIKSLFSNVWPECWQTYEVCTKQWVYSVQYLEIVGIMVGQIFVGIIGDAIGRRWGLIQDAAVMFVGLLLLCASWGASLNGWVICYSWSLFFYSIGVGGEYPMTATYGMEQQNVDIASSADDRLHRGRRVTTAFLMQGWGQLLNQALLIILLIVFHHGSGNPDLRLIDGKLVYRYSKLAVQWTFRVSFAIPAVGTLLLVYFRTYKMPSLKADKEIANGRVTGYSYQSLKLCVQHFGFRLVATCGCWFCNDVFFYGNKLFQHQFISVLTGGHNKGVILDWEYNLINIGCSMAGYYLASFTIDTKFWGRNKMQQLGFAMCFILFMVPGFDYKHYTSKNHVHEFQAMYFLSSFFNQFGPNAVTFLVAAEVFPTQVRASAHGIGAACGKAGALLASILFNYIGDQTKFYVVPWFGLGGMVLTTLFLPDVTGLDLRELDRRWRFITEGREHEYHGVAIHPRHLSLWERFRGVHKDYNPEADFKQKVDAMRSDWEEHMRQKFAEADASSTGSMAHLGGEVHDYFVRTSPMMMPQHYRDVEEDVRLPPGEEPTDSSSTSAKSEHEHTS